VCGCLCAIHFHTVAPVSTKSDTTVEDRPGGGFRTLEHPPPPISFWFKYHPKHVEVSGKKGSFSLAVENRSSKRIEVFAFDRA
jgi:hypothetical protein